jgi:hypothetical protein
MEIRALLDSGCTRSILSTSIVEPADLEPVSHTIIMMNGERVVCKGISHANVIVDVGVEAMLECLVTEVLPGCEMLLGMDAIRAMGGVEIGEDGKASFKRRSMCVLAEKDSAVRIDDEDFVGEFKDGHWTVEWKWNAGDAGPILANKVPQYSIDPAAKGAFEEEVREWIRDGWLQEYSGNCDGVVPLMAVIQPNKEKVRPVLDYREVNQYVTTHTAESEVCGEKLRNWRRMGTNVKILDLKKAYLQIHVAEKLWKFQVVKFEGKTYCLTRLGFGLNVAPKIMSSIVNKVLSLEPDIRAATDSYVDDIIVNEEIISIERVRHHLQKYGLEAKDPQPLVGGRMLGLRVCEKDGEIVWQRDNVIKELDLPVTKRDVFSLCGQLIGHFPVASWLRPACSFIKRGMNGQKWDEPAGKHVVTKLMEVVEQVKNDDPVKGVWSVPQGNTGKVWCDASSLAFGVCLEIGGSVVEDASWLRKENDVGHINLAELEAIIKGINLALRWQLVEIEIVTDSATVHGWLSSILTKDKRIKTRGLG